MAQQMSEIHFSHQEYEILACRHLCGIVFDLMSCRLILDYAQLGDAAARQICARTYATSDFAVPRSFVLDRLAHTTDSGCDGSRAIW
ncbi:MAG: hypothetical protein AAGC81_20330 [Pseudomonadota bacterium]